MNLKQEIVFVLEGSDKTYEKILIKLNDYKDVEGFDNLINLISCMNENGYFADFNNAIEYINNLNEFKYKKDPIYSSNNDFIKMACSQLGNPKFQLFNSQIVNLVNVEAILMLIEFNFYFYSNNNVKSIKEVVNLVFNSDIITHFTFFVDEFKEGYSIPNYSQNFFDKLSKITFDSDRSEHLYDYIIRNYLTIIIVGENKASFSFNSHIRVCAKYLMACNALKHGRDSVSCEDVVVGYTTALRLLTDDIREYVIKYYNQESNLKISDFKNTNNDVEALKDDSFGFKGVISAIFAILAFIEVICIILFVKAIIAPEMEFANNPIIRLGTLTISFYFAKKFYDYLTEGDDKNLFEDGKSKAMILFIIIFIITVFAGLSMF